VLTVILSSKVRMQLNSCKLMYTGTRSQAMGMGSRVLYTQQHHVVTVRVSRRQASCIDHTGFRQTTILQNSRLATRQKAGNKSRCVPSVHSPSIVWHSSTNTTLYRALFAKLRYQCLNLTPRSEHLSVAKSLSRKWSRKLPFFCWLVPETFTQAVLFAGARRSKRFERDLTNRTKGKHTAFKRVSQESEAVGNSGRERVVALHSFVTSS
jgi:hypothetical protein